MPAAHTVVDHGEAVGAQQAFEMLGPRLAFAREDISVVEPPIGAITVLVFSSFRSRSRPSPFRIDVGDLAGAARGGRGHLPYLQGAGHIGLT